MLLLTDTQRRNRALETQVQDLQRELQEAQRDANEARRELNCCKAAITLGGDPASLACGSSEDVKRRIDRMVREIDKCIALLKQ